MLWAPGIVEAGWVRENTRAEAELVDMARHAEEELVEVYRRAVRDKLRVVRLHGGDLATWGGLRGQLDVCARIGLPAEVIAGVSPVSAAAVSVGVSLTEPDFADSVITAGQETVGMPDLEQIRQYAQFGTTMAVLLPAARAGELADALRGGGYDDSTPVVAAYKVSWPDETVVRTTIGELVATVKQQKLWRHTLFLIGGAVRAGRSRAAGEPQRRTEGVVRWTRNRSTWAKRPAEKVESEPQPEPQPEPKRVTVVAEAAKKPAPAKAAAASTATKTVTAQAKKPPAAKTGAKQPAKTQAKTPAKKTARAQPQRGRRSGT